MIDNNKIKELSKAFALKMVNLYRFLTDEKKEYVLSKQLLRSGTSIGANIAEAVFAQSRADFYSKLKIAEKEAAETMYWLELLNEADYLDKDDYCKYKTDVSEILNVLGVICRKVKVEK